MIPPLRSVHAKKLYFSLIILMAVVWMIRHHTLLAELRTELDRVQTLRQAPSLEISTNSDNSEKVSSENVEATTPAFNVSSLDVLPQEDKRVIDYIKLNMLIPPPENPIPQSQEDTGKGQRFKILDFLNNMTGGFFIECGAFDGFNLSNTLALEVHHQWTGILIEADSLNLEKLTKLGRNAWILPTCLSLEKHPTTVKFTSGAGAHSRIWSPGHVELHCMPLFSVLKALDRTTVDLFSLDIEGDELTLLRTLPFDQLDIKTLVVEHTHIEEGRDKLLEFMFEKGYDKVDPTYEETQKFRWMDDDTIFVKKTLLKEHLSTVST